RPATRSPYAAARAGFLYTSTDRRVASGPLEHPNGCPSDPCALRSSLEDLLLGDRSASDAAASRLHADRGRPERRRTPECPAASVDRCRGDERPRARATDGGPIVDLDAGSEAAVGESGGGSFDAQLTLGHGKLGPGNRHGICSAGW